MQESEPLNPLHSILLYTHGIVGFTPFRAELAGSHRKERRVRACIRPHSLSGKLLKRVRVDCSDYREAIPELVGLLRFKKAANETEAADSEGDVSSEDDSEDEGAEAESHKAYEEEEPDASMFVLDSGEVFSNHDYTAMVGSHLVSP